MKASFTMDFYPAKVYTTNMIACILLSAGLSQRFGSPKALVDIGGEKAIERLQRMLIKTRISEIVIVLGAHANQIKPYILEHRKVRFVYNKNYNFGQTYSFKVGLQAIDPKVQAVLLLPVDYPFVCASTVSTLIEYFQDTEAPILIPSFQEKKGHPPLISIDLRDEFLALSANKGINSVLHAHESEVEGFPLNDPGVIRTFNTTEEFEAIKRSLSE